MATKKANGTLEELAAQYLDPTISVYESARLLVDMDNRFGSVKTNAALTNMREIMNMLGAKT